MHISGMFEEVDIESTKADIESSKANIENVEADIERDCLEIDSPLTLRT